ncbi:MAG: HAD-IIIA family hydrolase [Opitutaceae bacterium]|jgi:D-glycero-D-manno-heptose 1,7-bisphosphate phosphatase
MNSLSQSAAPCRLGQNRPAVFLDRDGTLNAPVVRDGKPYPPSTIEEFRLFPGAAAACRALHDAGFVLVVATNQPDVGRGTQLQSVVEAMHARLKELIPEIARIEVCYDPGRGESSRRRKPEPGMILDAAAALNIDLARSWMVGDRWRDIDCGRRAGLRTVFIDLGYDEELREKPDCIVNSITAAAKTILAAR